MHKFEYFFLLCKCSAEPRSGVLLHCCSTPSANPPLFHKANGRGRCHAMPCHATPCHAYGKAGKARNGACHAGNANIPLFLKSRALLSRHGKKWQVWGQKTCCSAVQSKSKMGEVKTTKKKKKTFQILKIAFFSYL